MFQLRRRSIRHDKYYVHASDSIILFDIVRVINHLYVCMYVQRPACRYTAYSIRRLVISAKEVMFFFFFCLSVCQRII